MDAEITCPYCGHPNAADISFCSECARFLRSSVYLGSLTLIFGILTALSALVWGAALYSRLDR